MTFQFDTSGLVGLWTENKLGVKVGPTYWSDLDPFTQGYVEALMHHLNVVLLCDGQVPFHKIAPETLARIMEDCAHRNTRVRSGAREGAGFWHGRQAGNLRAFPPLTPYLGEDGKVYLR